MSPQSLPFPVLEMDPSGKVKYCNPFAVSALEELGEEASPELFLPFGMEEILDALKQGRKILFDREVRLNHRVFAERICTLPELQTARIYAFDITYRVREEELLRRAYRESEDRTTRRTEELKAANDAQAAERQRLYSLLDQLPAFVCLMAPDLTFRFVNRRFVKLFGEPEGHRCFEVMAGSDRVCETCGVTTVLKKNAPIDWQWTSPSGRVYRIYDYPFKGPDDPPLILKLGIDVTEGTRAAEELQRSEERYRLLVEGMNEGLGVIDRDQVLTYVNDRLCEMVGYRREEMLGRPVTDFVGAGGRLRLEEQKVLRADGIHRPYEMEWIRKDGRRIATIVSPKPINDPDGRFMGSFAIITDITSRKRAEEALQESERQLHDLSAQLLQAQETERARISRELHDELGQALNLMKLRLGLIRRSLREDQGPIIADCDETLDYIERVIEDVRRLSRDLSPRILEDFGPAAALRRLVTEFARHSRIEISSRIGDINGLVSKEAEFALYRILQEALTNAEKHARAGRVSVKIEREGDRLSCLVEDDGRGFDVEPAAAAGFEPVGIGLRTMKERARMIGGTLELWSRPGEGSRVSLFIPIGIPGSR